MKRKSNQNRGARRARVTKKREQARSLLQRRRASGIEASRIDPSGGYEQGQPAEPYLGMSAMELAQIYSIEMQSDAEAAADEMQVIMLAAESLVDMAGPGRWDGFDAAEHFRRIDFFPEQELGMHAIALVGFYTWLALHRLVPLPQAHVVVEQISKAAPPAQEIRALLEATGMALHALKPN